MAIVLTSIGRYWRRLFPAPRSSSSGRGPSGTARLAVVPPPGGFTPRDSERVHAHGPAQGLEPERALDFGMGTLLVTSRGVIHVTVAKMRRFAWRGVTGIWLEKGRTLEIDIRSGRQLAFRLSSVEEGEAMLMAARAAWDKRSSNDR